MRNPVGWLATVALVAACGGDLRPPRGHPKPVATAPIRPQPVTPDGGTSPATPAPIGTDHPTVLIAASTTAQWVVHCEAREDSNGDGTIAVSIGPHGALAGDRMQPFLTLADGKSFPIDRLAAFDPTGRWVVVALSGRLVLVDATSGARTDLSAQSVDARSDAAAYRHHRALAFDSEGRALAYVRRTAGSEVVIVRDLTKASETTVTPAPGSVWRLDFEATGRSLLLHQTPDTDGDGRSSWPAPERETLPPCIGPIAPFAAWSDRADPVVTAVAPLTGGAATPVDGFVALLSAGVVVRTRDGRLLLRATDESELAPASCGARVLYADAGRNLLVVACSAAKGRSPVELVGRGLRQPLDIDIAFLGHDRAPAKHPRVVPLYPGAAPALLDLEQRRLIRLQTGDAVVVTAGTRALVHRGDRLLVFDAESGGETPLPGTTRRMAPMLATGSIGVVAPLVADAAQARLIGTIGSDPLAVARDGRVLIALGGDADADKLAIGPLAWRVPTPSEATGTPR